MTVGDAVLLIGALSAMCTTLSGIVLAFRVRAPLASIGQHLETIQSTSNPLPPNSPKPGESVADELVG